MCACVCVCVCIRVSVCVCGCFNGDTLTTGWRYCSNEVDGTIVAVTETSGSNTHTGVSH